MGSSVRNGAARRAGRYPKLLFVALFLAAALCFGAPDLQALTLNVVNPNGQPVSSYQWVIEEDQTFHPIPGFADPEPIALNFHKSYMPVVAVGNQATPLPPMCTGAAGDPICLDPAKYYYISVLPDSGYTNGGVSVAPGQATATAIVNQLPLPTAQISIFVFEDTYPISNAPDLPQELGLQGFKVILEEAGGRYGASGGQVLQDAFGNPLGTTYNPDGSIITEGTGTIETDVNGLALIKYLPPGKYGVRVSPPAVPPGQAPWIQTSTIEGSRVIDAWVKANEPPYFTEFGPAGHHCDFGFVRQMKDTTVLTGGATITGQVVNTHMSRPPDYTFWAGQPFPGAWVGLNDMSVGLGRGIYAAPCGANSTFTITDVPPGNYQLVIFDENLNIIFASLGLTVNPGDTTVALGPVAVFDWFAHLIGTVFYDANQNGFQDPGEGGIGGQAVNIRWRDGSVYQSTTTDDGGNYALNQVFPFFNWLVAEVDFLRFKATGATVVVDAGGEVLPDNGWTWPSRNRLTPQRQPENFNRPYRTETGEVLTQAFQAFLGQTNEINWGKVNYGPGENGGISGIVFYDTTRAEDNPRYNFGENWQAGIPRVQMVLYRDSNLDGVIDDLDGSGGPTVADVDNYPFQWTGQFDTTHPDYTGVPGPEDVDHLLNGTFEPGDAIQITWTDSWDDSLPEGCPGDVTDPFYNLGKCYDGLRNFNQVRPGVFDGGYAFGSYFPGGMASGSDEVDGLPTGMYIVQAATPQGYELVKEESKNVDFGDSYTPSPLALPPICVGDNHLVPQYLTLFANNPQVRVEAPFAGQMRPLCDRKQVPLEESRNAAADFFFFTPAPVSGHIKGMILNDLANEFDPNNPTFGEKQAPRWVPVSIRDFNGVEINRVYSDQYGQFNALVPSTYTTNIPSPSGMSPNMLITCMNDPGPVVDTNPASLTFGQMITDPYYDRQYSTFCYTFQYMPGVTTYLDTPVLPIAAFAGPNQLPLDCELPNGTPMIKQAFTNTWMGPYVQNPNDQLRILSMGDTKVSNPAYNETLGTPQTMQRDYGFGDTEGTVSIGGVVVPAANVVWTNLEIDVTVPNTIPSGQLVITRADNGRSTQVGVHVTMGWDFNGVVRRVDPQPGQNVIQGAIDGASPGDLVLVTPGIYNELVVLWKDVKLQGAGAPSTMINAVKAPGEKLQAWRDKITNLVNLGNVDLLPNQTIDFDPVNNEPGLLNDAEGPGVMVMAPDITRPNAWKASPNARIDGFTITGSDIGGAITVNGYAQYLEISNNKLVGNHGIHGGGIRLGHPMIGDQLIDSHNDFINIHHNHITQNGTTTDGAGGVAVYKGCDGYVIDQNYICGNFTTGSGGGIGHLGLSDNGMITNNKILFNQSFVQLGSNAGGGIAIEGSPQPVIVGGPTEGSGSVSILANLIQGNLASSGDGGGIRLALINGLDVQNNPDNVEPAQPTDPPQWHAIDIINNMIVNNVSGLAGGGISLQDAVQVKIIYNTVANNDSTATAGEAFTPGNPIGVSSQQPAGIISRAHSSDLAAILPPGQAGYSNPELVNNIIWHNRSFYWDVTANGGIGGLLPTTPDYWDLAVLGITGNLNPRYCVLTAAYPGGSNNIIGSPLFVDPYVNNGSGQLLVPENTTPLNTAAAIDEGRNFIDVRFGPLTPIGDYHLLEGSIGIGNALSNVQDRFGSNINVDYDNDSRASDRGADEYTNQPNATGVSVTWATTGGSPAGTPAGTPVQFTAGGRGPTGRFEYQFYLCNADGSVCNPVQTWSTLDTWVWATTLADLGTHQVRVDVRSAGDNTVVSSTPLSYTITNPGQPVVSMTSNLTSPQYVGTVIAFIAQSSGGSGQVEFQFSRMGPGTGGTWQIVQPFALNSTIWYWNAPLNTQVGTSLIKVEVRNVGETPAVPNSATMRYAIQRSTDALRLTNSAPPHLPGKLITFTATGYLGSGNLQYEFAWRARGSATWTIARPFAAGAGWTWDTTGLNVGSYEIRVRVLNVGTQATTGYDAEYIKAFVLRSPGGSLAPVYNLLCD